MLSETIAFHMVDTLVLFKSILLLDSHQYLWGHSSVVEHSTADRMVPNSILGVPSFQYLQTNPKTF